MLNARAPNAGNPGVELSVRREEPAFGPMGLTRNQRRAD